MTKIILMSEIVEQKLRKEQELEFYRAELEKIQQKIWFLQKDLEVTNLCITIIEQERDSLPFIEEKDD
jgi:hypothetical protein|tara:strand:- start:362 stop:565 length:204 start_codon:yes stop_codon:yes gene_type:complete